MNKSVCSSAGNNLVHKRRLNAKQTETNNSCRDNSLRRSNHNPLRIDYDSAFNAIRTSDIAYPRVFALTALKAPLKVYCTS